jgi:hypothetical protein
MPGHARGAGREWAWEHIRDYWLKNWALIQVLSEPSKFIQEVGPVQYARMEADNDDILITVSQGNTFHRLARPLEDAWQTIKLSKVRPTTEAADTPTGDLSNLQQVGLRIKRMSDRDLKLTNPNWLARCSRATARLTETQPFCRTPPVLRSTVPRTESPWSTHVLCSAGLIRRDVRQVVL